MVQLASVDELGELVHVDSDTPWEAGTGLGLGLADGRTVAQVDDGIGSLSVDPDDDEDDEDDDDEDDLDDDDFDDDDLDEEDEDDEDE
jgi:hypothetical protein